MSFAVETSGLTRTFGTERALEDLSFTIEPGEVLALLGPNGAGKTTTVRLLNGVLRPDRGTAQVLGMDPQREGNDVRRRTGVLTENAGLDERLTARENLELPARIRGLSRRGARERATTLLEQFGLADRADHLAAGFSTGQRKRVALARALLHEPELLFLDEPTSGLDPAATREVATLIQTLASEQGRTVVLATHFLGEAGRLADRMAVLHHGRLHAWGRPDELAAELWDGFDAAVDIGRPADQRLVDLVGAVPGVHGARPIDEGLLVHVTERETLPHLVVALTGAEVPVYGVESRRPTLEDVYFEIEARAGLQSGAIDPALVHRTTPVDVDGAR